MTRNSVIPIIFCVDVEPDEFQVSREEQKRWLGYEALFEYSENLRKSLEKQTNRPVNFSWFYRADPQIREVYGDEAWALTYYQEILDSLFEYGDELGIHSHAFRWNDYDNTWISDHADQQWVNHCIQTCYDGFKRVMGYAPPVHRFGARWLNNETMMFLQDLKIKYDLTLEPGYRSDAVINEAQKLVGQYPDLTSALRYPYKCKRDNFLEKDPLGLSDMWMIPMSTGMLSYRYGRRERLWRQITAKETLRPFCMSLHVALRKPRFFMELVNERIENMETPYLAMVMRSDSAIKENEFQCLKQNMAGLMNHPESERFFFCTAEQAMNIMGYEGQDVSCERAGIL